MAVFEFCEAPSRWAASDTLPDILETYGIPGISDIDTGALTRHLREHGTRKGKILVEKAAEAALDSGIIPSPVSKISVKNRISPAPFGAYSGGAKIATADCGGKRLRRLEARGAPVTRVPCGSDLSAIGDYDGRVLSNGPGAPKVCGKTIALVREAFSAGKPIFGVCLGLQLVALAVFDLIINVPKNNRPSDLKTDYRIRRMTVDFDASLLTNIKAARQFIDALAHKETPPPPEIETRNSGVCVHLRLLNREKTTDHTDQHGQQNRLVR